MIQRLLLLTVVNWLVAALWRMHSNRRLQSRVSKDPLAGATLVRNRRLSLGRQIGESVILSLSTLGLGWVLSGTVTWQLLIVLLAVPVTARVLASLFWRSTSTNWSQSLASIARLGAEVILRDPRGVRRSLIATFLTGSVLTSVAVATLALYSGNQLALNYNDALVVIAVLLTGYWVVGAVIAMPYLLHPVLDDGARIAISVTLLSSAAYPIAVAMCIGSGSMLPTPPGLGNLPTEWLPPLLIAGLASALSLLPAVAGSVRRSVMNRTLLDEHQHFLDRARRILEQDPSSSAVGDLAHQIDEFEQVRRHVLAPPLPTDLLDGALTSVFRRLGEPAGPGGVRAQLAEQTAQEPLIDGQEYFGHAIASWPQAPLRRSSLKAFLSSVDQFLEVVGGAVFVAGRDALDGM